MSDRFKYLKENEDKLIKTKRSTPDFADVCNVGILKIDSAVKVDKVADNGIIRKTVVANTANWLDSQNDLILPGAPAKSIRERKSMIPHLHDHVHQLDAKIGEVIDIYEMLINLNDLGIDKSGTTTVLIFVTDVYKSYNEQIYNQYKENKINQHSIGLQYIDMQLAINDPNDAKYYDVWNKYFDQIINKEKAINEGYFWAVKEYKLLENSSVLFGANELTPTLMQAAINAPEKQTVSTSAKVGIDYNYLLSKF